MIEIIVTVALILIVGSLGLAFLAPVEVLVPMMLIAVAIIVFSAVGLVRVARKTKWQTFARMEDRSLAKSEMRSVTVGGLGLLIGILLILVGVLFNVHVGYFGKMDNPPKLLFGPGK